jgi:hypothetical protein
VNPALQGWPRAGKWEGLLRVQERQARRFPNYEKIIRDNIERTASAGALLRRLRQFRPIQSYDERRAFAHFEHDAGAVGPQVNCGFESEFVSREVQLETGFDVTGLIQKSEFVLAHLRLH